MPFDRSLALVSHGDRPFSRRPSVAAADTRALWAVRRRAAPGVRLLKRDLARCAGGCTCGGTCGGRSEADEELLEAGRALSRAVVARAATDL